VDRSNFTGIGVSAKIRFSQFCYPLILVSIGRYRYRSNPNSDVCLLSAHVQTLIECVALTVCLCVCVCVCVCVCKTGRLVPTMRTHTHKPVPYRKLGPAPVCAEACIVFCMLYLVKKRQMSQIDHRSRFGCKKPTACVRCPHTHFFEGPQFISLQLTRGCVCVWWLSREVDIRGSNVQLMQHHSYSYSLLLFHPNEGWVKYLWLVCLFVWLSLCSHNIALMAVWHVMSCVFVNGDSRRQTQQPRLQPNFTQN